jgi:hypothetical protein
MNDLLTLTDHFRAFLAERPAISQDRLADELCLDRSNLKKILLGQWHISPPRRGDFISIMSNYGYEVRQFQAWG